MEKPIRYAYRIQYNEYVPREQPWNHEVQFWVERSSEIGSVLDGDWFACGTLRSEWRHDPDWGHYESNWTDPTYYKTSEEAEAWIKKQIEQYPKDYADWKTWEAGESARIAAAEAAAAAAAKKKADFESKNKIGKVFR